MNEFSIVSSLLDNDFYKFTMQNAVIKLFPLVKTKYEFINRGKHSFPKNFANLLKENLDKMSDLKLSNEERIFLEKNCPYLDSTYLDFLNKYQYNPKEVNISQKGKNIQMHIEGLWHRTILWEVPLMAIISELYYQLTDAKRISDKKIILLTKKKLNKYKKLNIKIGEYGTRRRFSYKIHKLVLKFIKKKDPSFFIGSSNVHLSHILSIKPIGTHGHEWVMFHAAKYGFNMADKIAMKNWLNIYGKNLGIALSDTYTTPIFFKNFDQKLANIFEGIRHDSGDPIFFTEETIKHYKKLKINPLKKKIIFSDNLNPYKIAYISSYCKNKITPFFCIGTNFTNDVGPPSMNIVIKMVKAIPKKKWISVIKLSNVKEKSTGDKKMIIYAKKILKIP
ncbi:nicotinate phosphoribosyltransferase [Blattabacterium punctulatus]|uniref:nicotinate phosphoribosyltransferase n=1 Tax=Blattabacterium punctulatus TaxID=164514 RepID=UPI000D7CEDBB|nr:nicotinate phosphoribosyltransferase [Blattabacterium punctulatus]AWU42562.1 nicotinate phosphoribosyltransferase [Blattabacterium punctulatus]AWU43106.1 nicotinate phosphoribosyltransferase [Blattabacterium punctulatus]AWU44759.1 nicotinate phosphoribosyltransferase [Blattabacterium punctulatus]